MLRARKHPRNGDLLSDLKSKCTFNHNTMSKEKSKPRLLKTRKHTHRQCQTCSWASLLPCRQGRLVLIPVPRACDGAGHATPRRGLGGLPSAQSALREAVRSPKRCPSSGREPRTQRSSPRSCGLCRHSSLQSPGLGETCPLSPPSTSS